MILLVYPLVEYNVALFVFLLYVLGSVKDIKNMVRASEEMKNE